MIDLHCHILPGLDDGARNWDESLEMARLAVSEGISHILATPHHMKLHWECPRQEIIPVVDELQKRLDEAKIPLTVFPGQEVHLHGELLRNIEQNEICFIDELKQYLLIEFPTQMIPAYTERLFFELQSSGITPIIVHPERNHKILEDPNVMYDFVSRGVLGQVTAASYIGKFGKKIEKLSHQLIEHNLVHFIASDAHNNTNRKFHMKEAHEKLERDFGSVKVQQFDQTTRNLVNGEPVRLSDPLQIKQKKFFGLF